MHNDFELFDACDINVILARFYASVRTQGGNHYSRSGLVNIRAGLNRHLNSDPFFREMDLMNSPTFKQANDVFDGQCRLNKRAGLDITASHAPLAQTDIQRVEAYFEPWLHNNVILQEKVFFELMYHFARRGREGLRALHQDSFIIDELPDGREYVSLKYNAASKTNQGTEKRTKAPALEPNVMVSQKGPNCPVLAFKYYLSHLNPHQQVFFQKPKAKSLFDPAQAVWYCSQPIGKNTLATFMKTIGQRADLSRPYTNHCIRGTSATALYKQGLNLQQVADVTGHRNLESLKFYLERPSKEDKAKASDALYQYSAGGSKKSSSQTTAKAIVKKARKRANITKITDAPKPKATKQSHLKLCKNGNVIYSAKDEGRVVESTYGPVILPKTHEMSASDTETESVTDEVQSAPQAVEPVAESGSDQEEARIQEVFPSSQRYSQKSRRPAISQQLYKRMTLQVGERAVYEAVMAECNVCDTDVAKVEDESKSTDLSKVSHVVDGMHVKALSQSKSKSTDYNFNSASFRDCTFNFGAPEN